MTDGARVEDGESKRRSRSGIDERCRQIKRDGERGRDRRRWQRRDGARKSDGDSERGRWRRRRTNTDGMRKTDEWRDEQMNGASKRQTDWESESVSESRRVSEGGRQTDRWRGRGDRRGGGEGVCERDRQTGRENEYCGGIQGRGVQEGRERQTDRWGGGGRESEGDRLGERETDR